MNRGKTIVSLLIAIVLAITLCACSTPDRLQPDTEQTGTQSPEESNPHQQKPAVIENKPLRTLWPPHL